MFITHITNIEMLDSILSVATDLRSLHVRVGPVGGKGRFELHLSHLSQLFEFSKKAATTLSRVSRLSLNLLLLSAPIRGIYLCSMLRNFDNLETLQVHGAACNISVGVPILGRNTNKCQVNHLLLNVDNPDAGRSSFEKTLACIDTKAVKSLALRWHNTAIHDFPSYFPGGDRSPSWRDLQAIHLLGPADLTWRAQAAPEGHRFMFQLFTWLPLSKQVRCIRLDTGLLLAYDHRTIAALMPAIEPAVTTLELGWPCGTGLLVLEELFIAGQLITSHLQGIRTIRFVTPYGHQPKQTWQYNKDYVCSMRNSFDRNACRRWLRSTLQLLVQYLQLYGIATEPRSFWTDLGANLARFLDDPSATMLGVEFDSYWTNREAK